MGFDTNSGGFQGPGLVTTFGTFDFIGPVATATLLTGQKAMMTVTNNIGVVTPSGGFLNLFPCYRTVAAPAGTSATPAAQSISVVGLPNSRQTYTVNTVYRPGSFGVPVNEPLVVGMCVLGGPGNSAWDTSISGYVSVVVFQ